MTEENNERPPIIDPTANVLEHVKIIERRLDDLREHSEESLRREMELRAAHQKELAAAEKERLDAIRSIDAQSIQLADAKLNNLGDRLSQNLAGTATLLQDRISTVERNQYVNAGGKAQQSESRQQSQWAVGAGFAVLGLAITLSSVIIAVAVR